MRFGRIGASLGAESHLRMPAQDFQKLRDNLGSTEIVKTKRIDLLQRGADHTPFMVSASGHDGYDNIIMGPSDPKLGAGDLLIIDAGTLYDGYYCDFDRNFAFGYASD